jgi:hypothetical protein
MALDFPTSPTNGQKFPTTPIPGVPTYTWDAADGKWITSTGALGGGGPSNAVPLINSGTGASGTALPYSREDHVHPNNAATAAEYISNSAPTKMLTSSATWGAAAPVQVTPSGSTIPINMGLGIDFFTILTSAGMSMALPTNMKPGQKGLIYIINNTGTATITSWDAAWKFPSGVKPVLTAAASAVDIISYSVNVGANALICSFSADLR